MADGEDPQRWFKCYIDRSRARKRRALSISCLHSHLTEWAGGRAGPVIPLVCDAVQFTDLHYHNICISLRDKAGSE